MKSRGGKNTFDLNTSVNTSKTNRWQFPLKFVYFYCETANMHQVIFAQLPFWWKYCITLNLLLQFFGVLVTLQRCRKCAKSKSTFEDSSMTSNPFSNFHVLYKGVEGFLSGFMACQSCKSVKRLICLRLKLWKVVPSFMFTTSI